MTARAFFLVVGAGGMAFFLLRRRRFDAFSIAFFGALAYFLPGFFGYVLLPRTLSRPAMEPVPIEAGTYQLMVAVLSAILCGAWAFDAASLDRYRPAFHFQGSARTPMLTLALSLLGLALMIGIAGSQLVDAQKAEFLGDLGRTHHLFGTSAVLGVVLAYVERRRRLGALFIVLLLFDVYLGFRFYAAIAAIAILCLALARQGRQRLVIDHWRMGLAGLATASSFFLVKRLIQPVRNARWDLVLQQLTTLEGYRTAITESEPFKTQAILNEVVRREIASGLDHFASLKGTVLIMSPDAGLERSTFGSEVVQRQLFPEALAGVASNIWAEMWSAGGWALMILCLVLWIGLLAALSLCVRATDPVVRALTGILVAYWGFYLHRNDLLYQLILGRRAVLVAALCLLLGMVAAHVRSTPPPASSSGSPDVPPA